MRDCRPNPDPEVELHPEAAPAPVPTLAPPTAPAAPVVGTPASAAAISPQASGLPGNNKLNVGRKSKMARSVSTNGPSPN